MSRADIAAEAMALEPGQSIRTVCPFCGGGSDRERSLSIKVDERTGLILYHCFRGNCTEAGVIGNSGVPSTYKVHPQQPKKPQPWSDQNLVTLEMMEGTDSYQHVINKLGQWCMGLRDYPWMWDLAMWRLAMPVYGPLRELRGYILRAVREGQKPKVLTGRIRVNDPFVSWHYPKELNTEVVICVEDVPSAIRVAQVGYKCVALLGNTPSFEVLEEIKATAMGDRVVFALDPDATGQAIRLHRQYGMRGASNVLVLSKDFKNMTNEEAARCLSEA